MQPLPVLLPLLLGGLPLRGSVAVAVPAVAMAVVVVVGVTVVLGVTMVLAGTGVCGSAKITMRQFSVHMTVQIAVASILVFFCILPYLIL